MEVKEVALKPPGFTREAALQHRVRQIEDEETRNYLLDRVLPQMTWYSQKSAYNKKEYHRFAAANICLCAAIPALAYCANNDAVKAMVALLGAFIAASNLYMQVKNFRGLWVLYKKAREELSHTLYCYFNKAGAFRNVAPDDMNTLLVNTCEEIIKRG